jgi:hypothetical protein
MSGAVMDQRREGNEEEEAELVLNPTVEVSMDCRVRRKGRPLSILRLRLPEDLELARWLVRNVDDEAAPGSNGSEDELSVPALTKALRAGILTVPAQLPPPTPAEFACELSAELLCLVPKGILSSCARLAAEPGRLRVNPDVVTQVDAAPPLDAKLWAHLVGFPGAKPHQGLSGAGPVLWVGGPRTHVYLPYWAGPEITFELVEHVRRRQAPEALAAEQRLVLLLAQILIPADEARAAEPGPAPGHLREHGYVGMGPVVPPLFLAAVRRHFRALRHAGFFLTDEAQVVGQRDGMYCDALAMFLQHALAGLGSRLSGGTLEPTYTWTYRYRPGAVLGRHTDRPQCRWNISLCVDTEDEGDQVDWPLRFQDGGEERSVNLQMGEAVLYSGTDTEHWRERLTGPHGVTFCLFHYVDPGFQGRRG